MKGGRCDQARCCGRRRLGRRSRLRRCRRREVYGQGSVERQQPGGAPKCAPRVGIDTCAANVRSLSYCPAEIRPLALENGKIASPIVRRPDIGGATIVMHRTRYSCEADSSNWVFYRLAARTHFSGPNDDLVRISTLWGAAIRFRAGRKGASIGGTLAATWLTVPQGRFTGRLLTGFPDRCVRRPPQHPASRAWQ